MTRNPQRGSAGATTFLAGAALVLATYLVMDRAGMFTPAQQQVRAVTPGGKLADWEQTTVSIFEQNSPSVVHITTERVMRSWIAEQRQATGSGSGFIWDEQGHVVTNHHVVKNWGREEIFVRLKNKKVYKAKYIHSYPYLDVAVVKIIGAPRNLRPIPLGQSANLKVGQAAFAIGNPFGLEQTLTTGIISALNRRIETNEDIQLTSLIQVDAAINPGNSGGPLLDSSGRLIGMNTAIFSRTGQSAGIGFAVPVDIIRKKMPRLLARMQALDAGLGIQALTRPWSVQTDGRGYAPAVAISVVTPGSGAAKAGLRPLRLTRDRYVFGDAILKVGNESVDSITDIQRILDDKKAGDKVELTVARYTQDGRLRIEKVTVTLGAL